MNSGDHDQHVSVIAQPDTGNMMIIGYKTDRTGGGVITISIGKIGHDEPDAEMELGASHAATAIRALQNGVMALAENMGDLCPGGTTRPSGRRTPRPTAIRSMWPTGHSLSLAPRDAVSSAVPPGAGCRSTTSCRAAAAAGTTSRTWPFCARGRAVAMRGRVHGKETRHDVRVVQTRNRRHQHDGE
jgi:hypothetical protein